MDSHPDIVTCTVKPSFSVTLSRLGDIASYSILREVVVVKRSKAAPLRGKYAVFKPCKKLLGRFAPYWIIFCTTASVIRVDMKTVVRRFGSWRSAIESALSHTRGNGEEES